jgi:hypothetical protein
MIVNRATLLLECFLQRWFRLVRLGLGFPPYSVSSFEQVLSKMRFPVPFTSFSLFSLFGNVRKRIPTFGNVKRVPTCVILWFLVCF